MSSVEEQKPIIRSFYFHSPPRIAGLPTTHTTHKSKPQTSQVLLHFPPVVALHFHTPLPHLYIRVATHLLQLTGKYLVHHTT